MSWEGNPTIFPSGWRTIPFIFMIFLSQGSKLNIGTNQGGPHKVAINLVVQDTGELYRTATTNSLNSVKISGQDTEPVSGTD